VPHIRIWDWELYRTSEVSITIQHPPNHNYEYCIWQLWEVTSHLFASALSQIHCWLLAILLSLLPWQLNLTSTLSQQHLNPLWPNMFRKIKFLSRQPFHDSCQTFSNHRHPLYVFNSKLRHSGLPPDDSIMLFLQKRSYEYFLPLVRFNFVGMPHPGQHMLQGELGFLQADCGLACNTAQVRCIITFNICILLIVSKIQYL